MPAPSDILYSSLTKQRALEAVRDLLDEGAGNATLKIRDESDTLLATVDFSDPVATVSAQGVMTFSIDGPATMTATGAASYAEICSVGGSVRITIPVVVSDTAVTNRLALTTASFVSGAELTISSVVIS